MDSLIRLDGAWATMLQARGFLPPLSPMEPLLLRQPEVFTALGRDYVAAGAQRLIAPTFRAGVEAEIEVVVDAALAALSPLDCPIVGCIGPASTFQTPWRTGSPSHFEAVARAFQHRGVRELVLQTFTSAEEAVEAVRRSRGAFEGTLVASMNPGPSGRLWDGSPVQPVLEKLLDVGADVVGFNCGTAVEPIVDAVYATSIDGLWLQLPGGAGFLAAACELAPRAAYLGGCCGTRPADIEALTSRL